MRPVSVVSGRKLEVLEIRKGKKVPRHAPACLIGCAAYGYYRLFLKIKRRHVTATTPLQGTVCIPNAIPPSGDPLYKI